MQCQRCGQQIGQNAGAYCPRCGAPLQATTVAAAGAAQPAVRRGAELECENLVQRRGIGRVVTSDHISLHIPSGSFVSIVGTSGAGKSTLLNMLCGAERMSEGHVFFNGMDLYDNYEALRHDIGVVPQDDILHNDITLTDELMASARLTLPEGTPEVDLQARVKQVIKSVELTELESSRIRNMSGGQRKRASIALELLKDPSLLFLDEPDSGLDEGTASHLMDRLRKMAHNEGRTIVMVTHAPSSVMYTDRVVVLAKGGKLCYYADPRQAAAYFGVGNFGDIYDTVGYYPDHWAERWKTVAAQMPQEPRMPRVQGTLAKPEVTSFGRQLLTLSARYARLIANDYSRFALLLLQAPLLAGLIAFFASENCFVIYESTKSCLFALSCAAFWVGIFDSIQEICKERAIFAREYNSGIRISAYVTSKVLVLGLLCLVQAVLMTATFALIVPETQDVAAPFGVPAICLSLFVIMLSAMCLGLLVSSVFANPERAMAMAPLLIMPQLLFSGVVIELKGAVKTISTFVNCRWGMSALGSIANLNGLTLRVVDTIGSLPQSKLDQLRPEIDATLFDRSGFNVFSACAVLLVFSIVCVLGCLAMQWLRTRRR